MILHRVEADKWGESCLEVETMEDSKVLKIEDKETRRIGFTALK